MVDPIEVRHAVGVLRDGLMEGVLAVGARRNKVQLAEFLNRAPAVLFMWMVFNFTQQGFLGLR